MSQYVAEKYRTVQEHIRALANKSGYGHFITDAMITEWSTDLISALAIVEDKYYPKPDAPVAAETADDPDKEPDDTGVHT